MLVHGLDGEEVRSFAGQVHEVNRLSHWCGGAHTNLPYLAQQFRRLSAKVLGFAIVQIRCDPTVQPVFVQSFQLEFDIAVLLFDLLNRFFSGRLLGQVRTNYGFTEPREHITRYHEVAKRVSELVAHVFLPGVRLRTFPLVPSAVIVNVTAFLEFAN